LIDVGAGALEAARRRGIPVGFTLHDYWLSCPRWGQRFHPDGTICETIDLGRCAECLTTFPWRQPAGAAGAARGFRWVRDNLGVDLATPAKRTLRALRAKGVAAAAPAADAAALRARLDERQRFVGERVIGAVALFIAPSEFLASEMARRGIPKNRIAVSMYGIEKNWVSKVARRPAAATRIAFHGSLMFTKGAHVLVEAWGKLAPAIRARATLTLRGAEREPAYVETLARRAKDLGAVLEGEFPRAALAEKLSSTDLLVVPSIWWENQPLSILEALAARVPVLVSDLGGMAELVREGRGGYRFRAGDAEDLARALRETLENPTRLSECVAAGAAIRSIDDDARELPSRILEATKT
jgi:glycosyltransferase involved in cell wall biosynthesis